MLLAVNEDEPLNPSVVNCLQPQYAVLLYRTLVSIYLLNLFTHI